jgi:hypothetical protein
MNLLELQVKIVMSGVPESGVGASLLDWTAPAAGLRPASALPFPARVGHQPSTPPSERKP